jgi:6,7-dimethyl-8-ribityllumazine synthase
MSTPGHNLSAFDSDNLPDASGKRFGIIVAEWNYEITSALLNGATETLKSHGVLPENIEVMQVPGSFELTAGASILFKRSNPDAVICLGCVIQGETRHFEFICNAVANGLTQLNVIHSKPFIFGVLTTDNLQQALDRAGGKHGNKGVEAAVTALKMTGV